MSKSHQYPRRIISAGRREARRRPGFPRIDDPQPQPQPDLPAPPPPVEETRPDVVPSLDRLPHGPFDPLEPLPWDTHRYPPIAAPSEEIYQTFEDEAERIVKFKRWLKDRKKKKKKRDPRRLPAPRRPELPDRPDRPALPAGGFAAEAAASFKEPLASGLIGPTPLELLDQYLYAQGIRHFSAKELTRHRWRHTRQVAPDIGDVPSSTWARLYREFPPRLVPKGVHFVLARCVVPDPDLWPSILPALIVLDRFREWLGKPVQGISAYRLPWYNSQIDGSPHSYHMSFAAIDFTYAARIPGTNDIDTELFVRFVETLYPQPGDGIGRYAKSNGNFIHYDRDMGRHEDSRKWLDWWFPVEAKRHMP